MSRKLARWGLALLLCLLAFNAGGTRSAADELQPAVPLRIGGTGGVYFLATPGELVVEVEKCDRNRSDRYTELRAILVGPDREILDEAAIPDAGERRGSGLGRPQTVRLHANVARTGVCALNVTVSQDRYGDEIAWGFRTNCPRYLIETARGHRDARHTEPIVLLSPEREGDVCFRPRKRAFAVEASGLPAGTGSLSVFDAEGALVGRLDVDRDGRASHTFAADVSRDHVPWRLHLPSAQATIEIDGVTRWDASDLCPNLACWTPTQSSWFPLLEYRWLVTPYSRNVYGEPGSRGRMAFDVENDSGRKTAVSLALEFPDSPWSAGLSADRVELGHGKTATVVVDYTVPAAGETRVCHLRATPDDGSGFTTYATLTVHAGVAPAAKPLDMPIVLKPYRHENEQFGYLPDCPVESQVYFDLENRPYVATGGSVTTLRDGAWTTGSLRTSLLSGKIAFDRDNDVYVLGKSAGRPALFRSRDGGRTFTASTIPGGFGAFDIEQFSGHNVPDGPPPVVRYTQTASDPKLIWRRINDLELILGEKTEAGVAFADPILISHKCIGFSAHSGIPSSVVSRGDKVHVVWAEATDPAEKLPGVPTFVVTYDRRTKTLGEPALIGYGAPANDVHNTPSITIDSQGYLHALAGTHGRPFQYARSLKPNDAGGGWTEAVPTGENLPQTYIGMVCGPDGTLHTAFRLWRYNTEPFPHSSFGTLACQQKRPGQAWQDPKVLIVPPFSEYSVYYHRLTIDRRGRLFLSYDYWSTYWFYRNDHKGDRRTLITSADGGKTWKLVDEKDFE